jgi:hypothetical protein
MKSFLFKTFKEANNFAKTMANDFFSVKLKRNTNGFDVEVKEKTANKELTKVTVNPSRSAFFNSVVNVFSNPLSDNLKAVDKKNIQAKTKKTTRQSIININGKFEFVKEKTIDKNAPLRKKTISNRTLEALKIADKQLNKRLSRGITKSKVGWVSLSQGESKMGKKTPKRYIQEPLGSRESHIKMRGGRNKK